MATLRRSPGRRQPGRRLAAVLLCLLAVGSSVILKQWQGAASTDAKLPTGPRKTSQGSSGKLVAEQRASVVLPAPKLKPRIKLQNMEAIKQRCQGTRSTWCTDYYTQLEVPAVTARHGNHTCSLDCNKVGTCNALSGQCTCPAGWRGFNCLHPMHRFCASFHRYSGFEAERTPPNLTMGVGWESIYAFPRSHCAGYCQEDLAACFCPSNTTYGRIPATQDAPLDARPVQRGRPMGQFCQPNKTPDGQSTAWGTMEPEDLYGPEGWCMAEKPKVQCECFLDGWGGPTCEEPYEQFCFNQCNGRGECNLGYCKCDPGWHGIDCAHRSSSTNLEQPGREAARPWIADVVHTPAAQEFPPEATRKRPLIYVYELPSEYNVLMVQYRNHANEFCVPRHFRLDNSSDMSRWTYAAEPGFLEMLLQSEHRTLDPDEADFFYVPVFTSCFINPVRDVADSLYDFFYSVSHNRVHGATNMMLEAFHWLRAMYPYWDRRDGRDHIWLVTHDEASCWVPAAVRPSIILSHWGRKDPNHTSGTGYGADVYSNNFVHPQFEPEGTLSKLDLTQPCYDPTKDLVVPLMKTPDHYHQSPLLGAPPRKRTWLAFHRGRVQLENPTYSRGIRQRLAKATTAGEWLEKHHIAVGEYDAVEGDYSELLASSVFCLVVPGDGWSARMDDAMLHGCIPVIIMDEVDVSFESIIDITEFTIRIPEADAEKLPEILLAVPQERREEMQRALARVWQRFTYSSYLPYSRLFKELQQVHNASRAKAALQAMAGGGVGATRPVSLPEAAADIDPMADDAFGTIMQWLHSRIEATR